MFNINLLKNKTELVTSYNSSVVPNVGDIIVIEEDKSFIVESRVFIVGNERVALIGEIIDMKAPVVSL